jgi:hypothetical protein
MGPHHFFGTSSRPIGSGPTSDTAGPLPIGLDDVPKKWWGPMGPTSSWRAWLTADGSTRPLKLVRPAQVRVFCGGHIGLKTDYAGEPVDTREPSVAKDGLAIASNGADLRVDPILTVSVVAPTIATPVIEMITDEFNKSEAEAVTHFTNWVHPYSSAERQAIPIQLESLYRFHEKTPHDGEWLVSYVEAIRRFPAGPFDRDCGLITWVRGWVMERPGKKPDLHLTARVTYCDREGVSFMAPLAHLYVEGESYWVYQMSSWRDEDYTVARVRPDEVRPVVNVFGGGCPKDAVK